MAGLSSPSSSSASSSSSSTRPRNRKQMAVPMDNSILEAAKSGDATVVKHLALHDPSVLFVTTPEGNSCLHIASIFGHLGFCRDVVALNRSLLSLVNEEGETPLLIATTSGHATLASFFIQCCRDMYLNGAVILQQDLRNEAILKQDKQGYNALHHAICCGHKELALELIAAQPALSQALNKYNESPMFIAVMRDCEEIFEKLLEIPDSKAKGSYGHNALHAAVIRSNTAIAKRIMETRPELARKESNMRSSPMMLAVDKIDMVKVLLECDRSLGYEINSKFNFPLLQAAYRGHVGVAQEILKHCPDSPYRSPNNGWTCLHEAVEFCHENFVEFVLGSRQLRKLINMRTSDGKTALHFAVQKCNPRMVRALLHHKDIDVTVLSKHGDLPAWLVDTSSKHAKTINWNEVSMLMLKASPEGETNVRNIAKEVVTKRSRRDVKSLTRTYTSNTSLVAILIATITFAAAFTLPGGYSSDTGNEGIPIMGRKLAFQAFLIADTLAMYSSLAVAFICIIAKWEDLEFLLYYRSFTKKLMWFAYTATTTAFATGLYTVLAPHLLWLAVSVCILMGLLPIFTKLLGEWPILKLRIRLGKTFKSEFLDMV